MIGWLYQMTANKRAKLNWSHEEHDDWVHEGGETTYNVFVLRGKGEKPQRGDMIVLFYAWTGDPKGGICGWGEVTGYDEQGKTIVFEPKEPSNRLKMKPMLNNTVKDIIGEIRCGFARGNMWVIPTDLLTRLRQIIVQVQRPSIL